MRVRILDTGVANRASMRAAFARLGVALVPVTSPADLASPDPVVLPGVGSFGAAMAALAEQGLVDALRDRVTRGDPLLAVCVGLQVLAAASEESPGVSGLGVLPTTVAQLPAAPRRPQLGWNGVGGQAVYFANGYALPDAPGFDTASFVYGDRAFVGAAWRGRVWGLQFHPELSGPAGAAWLRAWLAGQPPPVDTPSPGATRRIVPCLDIDGGRVVKGVRFQGLRDQGDPVELARAYADQGADELVLLDVSATPQGRGHALQTVAAVRQVLDVPLTVGGGVRTVADARALLEAGADKVAVNTAAVARPELLSELAAQFGRQCVVLSVDAARDPDGTPRLRVRSGTERVGREVVGWCVEAVARGAGEILLTSWDRDGTGDGYDLELLRAVCGAVEVPVVASGGAKDPACLADGLNAGADAVLAASMFHEGRHTVGSVKEALAARTLGVRPPLPTPTEVTP